MDDTKSTYKVEFDIEGNLVGAFSENGKEKLIDETKEYTITVAKEALLLAQADSVSNTKVEVVATHVAKAGRLKKKEYEKKKTPWYIILCKVVSPIAFAIAGFLFDFGGYQNQPLKQIGFIICIIIAAITTVFANIEG